MSGELPSSRSPPADGRRHRHKLVFLGSARGIAALMVVLYHISLGLARPLLPLMPAHRAPLGPVLAWAFSEATLQLINGLFAVRFFFVLSGFVLSLSYFRSRDWRTLRSAAVRRYPRLAMPVLGAMLAAWLITSITPPTLPLRVALLTHQPADCWLTHNLVLRIPLSQALRQGLYGAIFAFTDPSIDLSLWTMSVELANSFFIFALLPLVIRLPGRGGWYLAMIGGLLFMQQRFMIDFLAGLWLADVYVHHAGRWKNLPHATAIGALLIVGSLLLQLPISWVGLHFPKLYGYGMFGNTVCAMLILFGLLIAPRLQRWLEYRPTAFIGRISFSLYLIHVPIFASLGLWSYLLARETLAWPHWPAAVLSTGCTVIATIALATLQQRCFEEPGMALGRWIDRRVAGGSPGSMLQH